MDDFPAFTFPYTWEESTKIHAVNYGPCPIVDINTDGGQLKIYRRECSQDEDSIEVSPKYAIPLHDPNMHLGVPLFHNEDSYHYGLTFDPLCLYDDGVSHVDNFIHDNPKEVFSSLIGASRESHNIDDFNFIDIEKLEARLRLKRRPNNGFQDNRVRSGHPTSDLTALEIYNTCVEVPRQLLCDYISESRKMEHLETTEGFAYGNCLAFVQGVLLFPSGPLLDILNFQAIEVLEFPDEDTKHRPCLTKDSDHHRQFQLNGIIRQISASLTKENGNTLIAVRSDYFCVFLAMKVNASSSPLETIDIVCTHFSEVCLTSLQLNPYIHGEAVLTDEKGSIFLLQGKLRNCCKIREIAGIRLDWQQCFFGSSPRRFLVIQNEGVVLLDIRNRDAKVTDLLTLPNEKLPEIQSLTSGSSPNPCNSFQFFITTINSVLLMDERFSNHPLLKINHYLCAPAKHITYHMISKQQLRLYVTSYARREVITISIANDDQGFSLPPLFQRAASSKLVPPWRVISKPYKLSSFHEWVCSDDAYEYPFQRGAVKQRLMQPLIGLCLHTLSNENNVTFIFHLSRCGDLFWQSMKCQSKVRINDEATLGNSRFVKTEVNLPFYQSSGTFETYNHQFCIDWIQATTDDEHEEKPERPTQSPRPVKKESCRQLCDLLRRQFKKLKSNDFQNDTHIQSDSVVQKLKYLRSEKGIVTLKSLGMSVDTRLLPIMGYEQTVKDRLSATLHSNWINDTYTPLNVPSNEIANP